MWITRGSTFGAVPDLVFFRPEFRSRVCTRLNRTAWTVLNPAAKALRSASERAYTPHSREALHSSRSWQQALARCVTLLLAVLLLASQPRTCVYSLPLDFPVAASSTKWHHVRLIYLNAQSMLSERMQDLCSTFRLRPLSLQAPCRLAHSLPA
jgi:hypothetical protein